MFAMRAKVLLVVLCYIFLYLCRANSNMKRYKVRQVLRLLKQDGWVIYRTGTVTVNGKKSDNLSQELLNNIWKQAGWK